MIRSTDVGYLFGCCAACRAPFEPARALSPEEQSVLYMMSKFQEVSAKLTNARSDFTGRKQNAHFVTRAKYSTALAFATMMDKNRISNALDGWTSSPTGQKVTFKSGNFVFHSQVTTSGKGGRKAVINMETGAYDQDVAEAIRQGEAEAEASGSDTAATIMEKIHLAADNVYSASWLAPETGVKHNELLEWMKDTNLNEAQVSLESTTACCSLCNNIWDCWARMRATFGEGSVVKPGKIAVKYKSNPIKYFPAPGEDGAMQSRLGCMVAYYLHASLRGLKEGGAGQACFEPGRRPAMVMLLWLPLHVNCMYQEMQNPQSSPGNPKKGFHNYVGCLDLLISYYAYMCGRADPEVELADLAFEKFHVMYMKELSECPAPAWPDRVKYPRVHDFVFYGYPVASSCAAQVSHVSDRLQLLYREVAKPVLRFALGETSALGADARSFFLSYRESQELINDFLETSAHNISSIRVHLGHVGVHAIMWQLRRALARESREFVRELDKWINARMQVEWRNMAASGRASGLSHARLVYCAEHTRRPDVAALGEQDSDDEEEVVKSLRSRGLCSAWKAALRLRAWSFTTVPEVETQDYYEVDDDAGGLSGMLEALQLGPRLALQAGDSQAIQAEPRLAITYASSAPTPRRFEAGQRASGAAVAGARAPAAATGARARARGLAAARAAETSLAARGPARADCPRRSTA